MAGHALSPLHGLLKVAVISRWVSNCGMVQGLKLEPCGPSLQGNEKPPNWSGVVAVSVTTLPLGNVAAQVGGQLIPPGVDVTVP